MNAGTSDTEAAGNTYKHLWMLQFIAIDTFYCAIRHLEDSFSNDLDVK